MSIFFGQEKETNKKPSRIVDKPTDGAVFITRRETLGNKHNIHATTQHISRYKGHKTQSLRSTTQAEEKPRHGSTISEEPHAACMVDRRSGCGIALCMDILLFLCQPHRLQMESALW